MAVLAASLIGPMQVAGRVAMMVSERRLTNHCIACRIWRTWPVLNLIADQRGFYLAPSPSYLAGHTALSVFCARS